MKPIGAEAGGRSERAGLADRPRSRLGCALAVLLVIALGLASRRFPWLFPALLGKYPGDALWAAMVFALLGFAMPAATTLRLAVLALAISFAVEFGQLLHPPWLEAIRATTPGHLVLGSAFHALDLVAYTVGVGVAALGDLALARRRPGWRKTRPCGARCLRGRAAAQSARCVPPCCARALPSRWSFSASGCCPSCSRWRSSAPRARSCASRSSVASASVSMRCRMPG